MGDVRLTFDDGSVAHLHLTPEHPTASAPAGAGEEAGGASPGGQQSTYGSDLELPDGFGAARPVSADGRAARAVTRGGEALAQALRPLNGVLGSIHQSFAQSAHRPDEVTVEFGVTLGSDLSLGVFSGSGEASFTVSATWNLTDTGSPADDANPADPADDANATGGAGGSGRAGAGPGGGPSASYGAPPPTPQRGTVPGQTNGT
ncbi:hypothetical protein E0L36_23655 [Streptomyces sp. AJS327]|uniref:CU044_2847 family protein n=1 Tax=Streptomyces sp. AJS327 TaxID=2545265 RepID=UPI0015DFF14B|nr:CU044_2847 family protein [Streptomyces sp. AJS327]MBA0053748.1 hypothetical protein [Streptomyces sp. AJS327]